MVGYDVSGPPHQQDLAGYDVLKFPGRQNGHDSDVLDDVKASDPTRL
jgi:hypothetical protein